MPAWVESLWLRIRQEPSLCKAQIREPFVAQVLHKTSRCYLQGSGCHRHVRYIWWHLKHHHVCYSDTSPNQLTPLRSWGARSGTLCSNTLMTSNPFGANKKPKCCTVSTVVCTQGRNSTFSMILHDPKGRVTAVRSVQSPLVI